VRRRTKKELKLTAEHAAIALQMLIHDGKIAAGDVAKALKRREKMIKELRQRLSALEDASRPAARKLVAASRNAVRRAAPRARKAITRAQKTARQAQGRYMAAVRRLSKNARVRIKKIRKQSGVDAAVRAALKMAK
jgi:ElaB/YqjD/DUF883 family membrane-anchored ribosome-binding protein